MKITKAQLKQIIKEELGRVLEQSPQGYTVRMGAYGTVSFLDPDRNPMEFEDPRDGQMEPLSSSDLMQFTENLPEFYNIVSKEFMERHRESSRWPYPDPDAMVDYGGFVEGKGYQDLLDLYVAKVLNK